MKLNSACGFRVNGLSHLHMGSLIGGIHTSKVYLNSDLHSPSAQHNKLIKGHKIEENELQNIDVTMHKEAIDSPNLSVTTRPYE